MQFTANKRAFLMALFMLVLSGKPAFGMLPMGIYHGIHYTVHLGLLGVELPLLIESQLDEKNMKYRTLKSFADLQEWMETKEESSDDISKKDVKLVLTNINTLRSLSQTTNKALNSWLEEERFGLAGNADLEEQGNLYSAAFYLDLDQFMRLGVISSRLEVAGKRVLSNMGIGARSGGLIYQTQDKHIQYNASSVEVKVGDEVVDHFSPKELKLLAMFLSYQNRVFDREAIIEQVWGPDFFGDTKTVDVHVRWLREKLEKDPSNPEYLVTVRGFGYRLNSLPQAISKESKAKNEKKKKKKKKS